MDKANVLLEIDQLKTTFRTVRGPITAVDGLSLKLHQGEILGIVGESGCGKTVTAQTVMRLYDEKNLARYQGNIRFNGQDLLKLSKKSMEAVRGKDIAMIFQDPLSSLDPLFTVGDQIAESIMKHRKLSKAESMREALELLKLTNIPSPEQRMKAYPHELSGGMCQRVMISIALACRPKLLIADEPTTALDVTIQAQIMNLIIDLNKKFDMSVILITHDLGVVANVCQRVIIMYLGEIVEEGLVTDIFDKPRHPYTSGLIKSIPKATTSRGEPLYMIQGSVPMIHQVGKGCRFANRCECVMPRCREEAPPWIQINGTQAARCWLFAQQAEQGGGEVQ
jgi:oligopeptide/dipeptide ABC transporter ATP-binding protein